MNDKNKNSKLLSVLLSLAIAFGMWLYVITTVSPGYTGTINDIRVAFEGEGALQERGLMITDGLDAQVDLTLTGNRSDYSKLTRDNITIRVDLTKIYDPGIKQLDYDISYPSDVPSNAFVEENRYPGKITITVEKKETKPVEVQVNFTGAAKEGYIAETEEYVLDYPNVTITGPSSVVEEVAFARINVDLTDRTESISDSYRFMLCDKEGNPVDVEMITTDVAEVHLDVQIQRWKEIPLKLDVKYGGGALESNTSIIIEPRTIRVSGSELMLEDLEEIILGSIDLSTLEEDLTQTYTITLPEGVTNMTGKTEATVEIKFLGLTIKEFEISQIDVINVPEGLEYDLLNEVVKVRLRGPTALINQLRNEDIVLLVDLSGKEIGSFTVKPTITIKGDAYVDIGAIGPHSISIALKEIEVEATEN